MLAGTLFLYGTALFHEAGPQKALPWIEEAREIGERLNQDIPAVHGPRLAETLALQARCLEGVAPDAEAGALARKAFDLLKPHYQERPKALHREMKEVSDTLLKLTGEIAPADILLLLEETENDPDRKELQAMRELDMSNVDEETSITGLSFPPPRS